MIVPNLRPAALLFALLLGAACASGGYALGDDADAPLRGGPFRVVVHGMSCPLCATNVDRAIAELPGVDSVAIDMASGEVMVALQSGASVTRRALASAVASTGFTLVSIEAP
ncbi:MAG: heavy-metal-associated domain-containing protein [Planctomycetes bacterium]|nr:heavy-metal-associated domain-containing protein [Planctomycetota bacterium]